METLLVETPDPDKWIAYMVAKTPANPNPLENKKHAAALLAAWRQTNVEDRQAIILFDLYDKGLIFSHYRTALAGLCDALDPASKLGTALFCQNPTEKMNELEIAFDDARYGLNFEQIYFSSYDGLRGLPTEDGRLKVYCSEIESETFNDDNPGLAVARAMGLTHYTDQFELRWPEVQPESGAPFPVQLSNRCHTALGVLGADGQFEHVLTVLSEDHPARQP